MTNGLIQYKTVEESIRYNGLNCDITQTGETLTSTEFFWSRNSAFIFMESTLQFKTLKILWAIEIMEKMMFLFYQLCFACD